MYGFYWPSRAWLLAALVPSEDQGSPTQPSQPLTSTVMTEKTQEESLPLTQTSSPNSFQERSVGLRAIGWQGHGDQRPGKKTILYREIQRKSYCTERFGENPIVQRDSEKERLEATHSHPRGKREAESHDRWNELWKLTFCGTEGPILGTSEKVLCRVWMLVGWTESWYPQVTLISAIFEYISLEHQMRVFNNGKFFSDLEISNWNDLLTSLPAPTPILSSTQHSVILTEDQPDITPPLPPSDSSCTMGSNRTGAPHDGRARSTLVSALPPRLTPHQPHWASCWSSPKSGIGSLRPWHRPFPCPVILSPDICLAPFHASFRSLLRCHLLRPPSLSPLL